MKRQLLAAALALAPALAPAAASADFMTANDLVVRPLSPTRFEIPYRGKSGAPDFWCAAGDYVVRSLNLSGGTPIWRVSEPPRRSGEGITFSLRPEGAASSTGLATFGSRSSLRAEHARQLCEPMPLFPID